MDNKIESIKKRYKSYYGEDELYSVFREILGENGLDIEIKENILEYIIAKHDVLVKCHRY